MKNKSLIAVFALALASVSGCSAILDGVAASCPAGAAAVAGLRSIVGTINEMVNGCTTQPRTIVPEAT